MTDSRILDLPHLVPGIAALDELAAGRPRARRNLHLGLWAGRQLGLGAPELAVYALGVMEAGNAAVATEAPAEKATGDDAALLLHRLAGDLAGAVPEAELRAALAAVQRRFPDDDVEGEGGEPRCAA